jgi:hypothetical protein
LRNALIVSPFASSPADAGHRRRVLQTTKLLRDNGYRITFVLLAFEDAWYWSFDQENYDIMKRQWDEVVVVPAARHVALPPKQNMQHDLDEWWDAALEQTIVNLCSRRTFDLVLVHNVWLSKVFDLVGPNTVKALETHDLFWRRPEIFRSAGLEPEFFIPNEQSELFGIHRGEIALMIQESEAIELARKSSRAVVTLPYYDPELEQEAPGLERNSYLHPEKVSFGFLGSANGFNVRGMNSLIAALEDVVMKTYAPVELVVGGAVGRALEGRLPVRRLGRVPAEADLYKVSDIAIAPVFSGTGFKIKTADILALGMPMLAAEHAVEGISIDSSLVFATPQAMAEQMARIALCRPSLSTMRQGVLAARAKLKSQIAMGSENFLRALQERHPPVVFNLASATLDEDVVTLISVISRSRVLIRHRPVLLVLPDALAKVLRTHLTPGVRAISRDDYLESYAAVPGKLVVEMGLDSQGDLQQGAAGHHAVELSWRSWHLPEPTSKPAGPLGALPLFDPSLSWDPAAERLRNSWRATQPLAMQDEHRLMVVFSAGKADVSGSMELRHGRAVRFIDIADRPAVVRVLMRILTNPSAVECVWAAPTGLPLGRVLVELCMLMRVALWGSPVDAFIFKGQPVPTGLKEMQDRAAEALQSHFPSAA